MCILKIHCCCFRSTMKLTGRCGIALRSQDCSPMGKKWHSDSFWITLKYVELMVCLFFSTLTCSWHSMNHYLFLFCVRTSISWRSPCFLRECPCCIRFSCLLPNLKRDWTYRECTCRHLLPRLHAGVLKFVFTGFLCVLQYDGDCDKGVQKEAGQTRESPGVWAML